MSETKTTRGIQYDEAAGLFRTNWGTIKLNISTGAVEVRGPSPEKWLDLNKACETAKLFVDHCPTVGWAIVHAIHQQFAAWRGSLPFVGA